MKEAIAQSLRKEAADDEVRDALVDPVDPVTAVADLGLAVARQLAQVLRDALANVGDPVAGREPVFDGFEKLRLHDAREYPLLVFATPARTVHMSWRTAEAYNHGGHA